MHGSLPLLKNNCMITHFLATCSTRLNGSEAEQHQLCKDMGNVAALQDELQCRADEAAAVGRALMDPHSRVRVAAASQLQIFHNKVAAAISAMIAVLNQDVPQVGAVVSWIRNKGRQAGIKRP